jgi:hypothetical protein
MASTDPSAAAPEMSIAEVFLGRLATADFIGLGELLEPDVSFSALLPGGLHEWKGPDRVTAAFVGWFGSVDAYELIEATIGQVGRRLQLQWCARVRGGPYGPADLVVAQHLYADRGPSGRIKAMSMLCSGFAKEHPDG